MQIAVLCKENAFSCIYNSPHFASKQTFARIDYLRSSGSWWITMALIVLKFLLKTRQNACAIYTRMGNGTESTYTYDHQRERLQGMLLTANGDSIMQTQYKYVFVDNILVISCVIKPKAPRHR